MRDLFFKLFEMSHFDTGIKVTAFSPAHFVYLVLIIGSIVGLYFLLRKKSPEKIKLAMNIMISVLLVSYVSDFFVHEFVYAPLNDDGSWTLDEAGKIIGGGLNMDKLPFHICTVLCPVACFTQFNKHGKKILEPVVLLSILAPMMYLCYPANIGDGEPWCYQAVQTMFYHGLLMTWGILNVALGVCKPKIKNCWHSAILLVCITLWAKLGNVLLEHNWFFLNEDAFYIGLVEKGFIPQWLLMIINPIVFFLAVLLVYGVIYAIKAIKKKVTGKESENEEIDKVAEASEPAVKG